MSKVVAVAVAEAAIHRALIVGGPLDQLWAKLPPSPEATLFANELQDVLVLAQDALAERQAA